jgi:hypothetical protein
VPFEPDQTAGVAIRLIGDRDRAARFIPTARKLAEMIQGQLNLGTNLGQSVKSNVVIADGLRLEAVIHPGIVNRLAHVNIFAELGEGEGEEEPVTELPTECPLPPPSREGARLFQQMFGEPPNPDDDTIIFEDITSQVVTIDQTYELAPFGQRQPRGNIALPEPFVINGKERTEVWFSSDLDIYLAGPRVINYPAGSGGIVDGPCTFDIGAGPAGDGFGGTTFDGLEDLHDIVTAGGPALGGRWTETSAESHRIQFGVGKQETGESNEKTGASITVDRKVLLFTNCSRRPNNQVVFMYPGDGCPAYVGFLYGGFDGIVHWGPDAGAADEASFKDEGWTPPWRQNFSIHTIDPSVHTWTGICEDPPTGLFFGFPQIVQFFITNALNVATAYPTYGDTPNHVYVVDALDRRAIWIELDGEGFPAASVAYSPRGEPQLNDVFIAGS